MLSSTKPRIRQKLLRWGGFSVAFPLVPLGVVYGKAEIIGPLVTISELIARGGLLIFAVGLVAGAMADLLTIGGNRFTSYKIGVGALCLVILFIAAVFYTFVSDAYTLALQNRIPLEDTMNVGTATGISLVIYGVAVVVGGACVVMATLDERASIEEAEERTRAEIISKDQAYLKRDTLALLDIIAAATRSTEGKSEEGRGQPDA